MKNLYYSALLVMFPWAGALAQAPAGPALATFAAGHGGGGNAAAKPAARFAPDSIFVNPQVRPQFTGGDAGLLAYLKKNMHYPQQAQRDHATGKVYIRFIVSAAGRITDASMVRGAGHGFDEEALRLVWLMPPWQPGYQDGQPVRVSCTMPITFAW